MVASEVVGYSEDGNRQRPLDGIAKYGATCAALTGIFFISLLAQAAERPKHARRREKEFSDDTKQFIKDAEAFGGVGPKDIEEVKQRRDNTAAELAKNENPGLDKGQVGNERRTDRG